MHLCSSAREQMVLETLAPWHTTMHPASPSMAASWLSARSETMTTSPLEMDASIMEPLPAPTTMLPVTTRPETSPASTTAFKVSTMFS